jgi:hypothetical protein
MNGAMDSEDLSNPRLLHSKKARQLRWGHKDETTPGHEDVSPEEARLIRDKED